MKSLPLPAPGMVEVWWARLDQPDSVREALARTLSQEEQRRAARYIFEPARQNFSVGRGLLRVILGWYLDLGPDEVSIQIKPGGKPALTDSSGAGDLRFNLSHAGQLVIYAFAKGQEVGIDVEEVRPIEARTIAQRFFSLSERAELETLPPEQQLEGFFNCWTRKEAYLKVCGAGLALPLDQFDVSLKPGEPARLLALAGDTQAGANWTLHSWAPLSGYQAALALEAPHWKFSFRPVSLILPD